MDKNRITVIIDGQEYKVITEDNEMHVLKISEMVDKKIREIKTNAKSLNSSMVSVLAAMNIADEYIKFMDSYEKEKKNGVSIETRDKLLVLEEKVKENDEVIGKLNKEILNLKQELAIKEHELQIKKIEIDEEKGKEVPDEMLEIINERVIELENTLTEKNDLLSKFDEKNFYLQQKLTDKEEELQIKTIELEKEKENKSEEEPVELINNHIEKLENELKDKNVIIEKYDEKIFYLQRKLTDKEEELQKKKSELDEFMDDLTK